MLPPLGILYISSYLRRSGMNVKAVDRYIEPLPEDYFLYDIVGLSINLGNISSSLSLINRIKSLNDSLKIVVGGPSCISNPDFFKENNNIDAICSSEGEQSMYEYVKNIMESRLQPINGFYIRDTGNNFITSDSTKYINDLDDLPFPDFNKDLLKKYYVPLGRRQPVSSIIFSRGCPMNCAFCFHALGKEWRPRSVENIIQEIEWQVNELGVKEICIEDDNILYDIERLYEIFNRIIEKNIEVNFQIHNGIRIEHLTKNTLDLMKKAGVWLIALCPETASMRIMKKINKIVDLAKFKKVINWCRDLEIVTYVCFIMGFPYETEDDIKITEDFISTSYADVIHITRATPIYGTQLYKDVKRHSGIKDFNSEDGMLFGGHKYLESDKENLVLQQRIKMIYHKFYLNPKKIFRLLRILPIKNLISLAKYSLITNNI